MKVEINGTEYAVKITLDTLRKLDKVYEIEERGMKMSFGANFATMYLEMRSVPELAKVLRLITEGDHNQGAIDKYIEDYAEENGEIGSLFDSVAEELGKSPLVKETVENFKETWGEQVAEANK